VQRFSHDEKILITSRFGGETCWKKFPLIYRIWGRKTKLSLNEGIWIAKVGGRNWLRFYAMAGFMVLNLSVLW
jgi:hypothetical protein